MALKCTEISFFMFNIQIGSSTSIFVFPGVELIEKPKFGDQKLSSLKSSKKKCLTNDNFFLDILYIYRFKRLE